MVENIPVELVPAERPRGQFAPGNPGRPKNSLNKLTRIVKEQLTEKITSGEKTHPALVLLNICNDAEIPVNIRRAAASDLLPYIMSIKHSIELETNDADEMAAAKIRVQALVAEWTPNATPRS